MLNILCQNIDLCILTGFGHAMFSWINGVSVFLMKFYTNLLWNTIRNLPIVSSELNLTAASSVTYWQYRTGILRKPQFKTKRSHNIFPYNLSQKSCSLDFQPRYFEKCRSTHFHFFKMNSRPSGCFILFHFLFYRKSHEILMMYPRNNWNFRMLCW